MDVSDFIIKYFQARYLYLFMYDLLDMLDRFSSFIEILIYLHERFIEYFNGYAY